MRICAHDFISTERLQQRKPMISVGFARVSKKRPCRICGKPTYCGFSRDEGTSICMRISAGSRGLSRNGGNIHVHPEIPFMTIRPRIQRPMSQSISLASLEIRDAVFGNWFGSLPLVKQKLPPGETVLITEGPLKAENVVRFKPNTCVIGSNQAAIPRPQNWTQYSDSGRPDRSERRNSRQGFWINLGNVALVGVIVGGLQRSRRAGEYSIFKRTEFRT